MVIVTASAGTSAFGSSAAGVSVAWAHAATNASTMIKVKPIDRNFLLVIISSPLISSSLFDIYLTMLTGEG